MAHHGRQRRVPLHVLWSGGGAMSKGDVKPDTCLGCASTAIERDISEMVRAVYEGRIDWDAAIAELVRRVEAREGANP
jgi:hypothetical protein